MNKQPAAALGALAVAGALALTGCQGLGGGGTTTIIQQPPAANNTPASSTPTTTSVTPISDGKQLCLQARTVSRDVTNDAGALWKILRERAGWSWHDEDVMAAADKLLQAEKNAVPQLKSMVGPGAPSGIADAIHTYIDTAEGVAQAVASNATNDELNPWGTKFEDAYKGLMQACQP